MRHSLSMFRLLVAAALLSVACGGPDVPLVSFTPTNAPPQPTTPRASNAVEVFTSGAPARPYVELGIIEVTESREAEGTDALLVAMRGSAADRGCDAVVVIGRADHTRLSAISGGLPMGGAETLHGFRGSCVVYR